MAELFLIIGISIIIGIVMHCISKVKCYRVVANSYLNMNNETITSYTVQQKHSLFRGMFTYWNIQDSGDEYSSGSVFDKLEEADQYIKSLLFDRKQSVKISNTICDNSTDKDVKFKA